MRWASGKSNSCENQNNAIKFKFIKIFGYKMNRLIRQSYNFTLPLLLHFWKIPYYMKFSWHVNFAIMRCTYFATLKFRDFAKILYFESLKFRVFEWDTIYIFLAIYFDMPLNYIKRLHRRNNNVKINKNAVGDLISAIATTEQFSQCLQVSQLTTTSIYIDYWHTIHLIFASCYVRDTFF